MFWHRPAAGQDAAGYEARLTGFHAALAADPPPGYGGSCALRLDGDGYEDWYLVPGWAELGELSAHAVTGSRSSPHAAAAAAAGGGAAGVYALLAGPPDPPAQPCGAWLAKPAGMSYAEFHPALVAALGPDASAWQRQLTLGPAGEYTVRAPEPVELPWPATPVRAFVLGG